MNGERPGRDGKSDPSRLESARIVACQGRRARRASAGQEAGPDQDLESVADPQDQSAAVVETPQSDRRATLPSRAARMRPAPRSSP